MNDYEPELNLKPIYNCPICKGTELKIINKIQTINPNSDLKVEILKCVNCLHWFVNPSIDQNDLNILYKEASEYVVPKGWDAKKTAFSIPEQYIIKNESKNLNTKYLEIGIGSGLLFNYFKQIGYNCFGVEPGDWGKGITNIVQDINELDEDNFDVVVLADILEHVEDPLSLVKKVSKLINVGTVYVCFPNNQSLRALLLKERWRMIRPFGHLHFFSKKSLSILFNSNGFKIKRLIKTDLLKFSMRTLFKPPYFLMRMILFSGQSFFGDQWIIHLTRNLEYKPKVNIPIS